MAFGKVDGAELGGSLAVLVVALEDRSSTFSLGADNSSHFFLVVQIQRRLPSKKRTSKTETN